MANNYGLGRGLASLIPPKQGGAALPPRIKPMNLGSPFSTQDNDNPSSAPIKPVADNQVDVNLIEANPHQPRKDFSEEKLNELAKSITRHGIIQPLVVSNENGKYQLIAGERRLRAAKLAGLTKVPVVVREAEELGKIELALAENIQRHDLSSIEEARTYKKMIDEYQMSQEEVADKIGKSRSAVANKIRLLNLPIEIQKALSENLISEGHAKSILSVTNPEQQRAMFDLIIKDRLSVRQIEEKTKSISVKSHRRTIVKDPVIAQAEEKLTAFFGTKVKVTKSGNGGRIIIDYYSPEELSSIKDKLGQI
jgi:ParB family transcriptional regulator, chromosome partitioning protein